MAPTDNEDEKVQTEEDDSDVEIEGTFRRLDLGLEETDEGSDYCKAWSCCFFAV